MKVILSRKGFDSGAGGVPSPIFDDGTLYSLPIPDARSKTRYSDISIQAAGENVNLGGLVAELTRGKMPGRYPCHLDPDLDRNAIARDNGWLPAFGQTGAAQTHLESHQIGAGDLFIYFGWFRQARREKDGIFRFVKGAPNLHVIFGWMQVGSVEPIFGREDDVRNRLPWLEAHPHLRRRDDAANHIYIAPPDLKVPGLNAFAGGGTFGKTSEARILTLPGQTSRSLWNVPSFFHPEAGASLSYHGDPERWTRTGKQVQLKSVARGQEFVLDAPAKAMKAWLSDIFA
jgi:hypothetical protein